MLKKGSKSLKLVSLWREFRFSLVWFISNK